MSDDDKLAPHPSPWSVVDRGPGSPVEIRDANGQIAFYAPRDRGALIAAAPEMEALLREYMTQGGACPSCKKVRPALLHNGALPRGWHAEDCRLGLLIERIDVAAKR